MAVVPLNDTVVTPLNPEPVITTVLPMRPLVGVNAVIAGRTVNWLALVAVPVVAVTVIYPVVAVAGTVAEI
jgi:hypothetical protein